MRFSVLDTSPFDGREYVLEHFEKVQESTDGLFTAD
jgi:hypothetical protein